MCPLCREHRVQWVIWVLKNDDNWSPRLRRKNASVLGEEGGTLILPQGSQNCVDIFFLRDYRARKASYIKVVLFELNF